MSSNVFLLPLELRCIGSASSQSLLLAGGLAATGGILTSGSAHWLVFDIRVLALLGLITTTGIAMIRLRLRHVDQVLSQCNGCWQLRLSSGACVDAKLYDGWIAGGWAGLAWRGMDRKRYCAIVRARAQSRDDWRRLRVRLRFRGDNRVE